MKIFIILMILVLGSQCSTGISPSESSSGGGSSSGQVLSPISGGAGSGGGVSTVGTLVMTSSIGQAISPDYQVSTSGRYERQ